MVKTVRYQCVLILLETSLFLRSSSQVQNAAKIPLISISVCANFQSFLQYQSSVLFSPQTVHRHMYLLTKMCCEKFSKIHRLVLTCSIFCPSPTSPKNKPYYELLKKPFYEAKKTGSRCEIKPSPLFCNRERAR